MKRFAFDENRREMFEIAKGAYVLVDEVDKLRFALKEVQRALVKHDRTEIDYESHPASACLVDFEEQIKLIEKALKDD